MRVLVFHNRYKLLGGEDVVLSQEINILREKGYSVELVSVSNESILDTNSLLGGLGLGLKTIWSLKGYSIALAAIKAFRPDVIHVHNFFPLLSPSIYWAAKQLDVPVVQTLHNYRLLCANGLLFRDGHPCELCVGSNLPLPALRYRCYRNSFIATLPLMIMQIFHGFIGTFRNKVDAYIALTNFSRQMFIRGGIPQKKLYVKPNFAFDPSNSEERRLSRKRQFIYVGRIASEKGVDLLLDAWQYLQQKDWQLVIVGDGPERLNLQGRFSHLTGIDWIGWLEREDVVKVVGKSSSLVVTSRSYESALSLVVLEALSVGTPVLVPNHGGFPEIISQMGPGWLFEPNNAKSLADMMQMIINLEQSQWDITSRSARDAYEKYYTSEANYNMLMEIYNTVLKK